MVDQKKPGRTDIESNPVSAEEAIIIEQEIGGEESVSSTSEPANAQSEKRKRGRFFSGTARGLMGGLDRLAIFLAKVLAFGLVAVIAGVISFQISQRGEAPGEQISTIANQASNNAAEIEGLDSKLGALTEELTRVRSDLDGLGVLKAEIESLESGVAMDNAGLADKHEQLNALYTDLVGNVSELESRFMLAIEPVGKMELELGAVAKRIDEIGTTQARLVAAEIRNRDSSPQIVDNNTDPAGQAVAPTRTDFDASAENRRKLDELERTAITLAQRIAELELLKPQENSDARFESSLAILDERIRDVESRSQKIPETESLTDSVKDNSQRIGELESKLAENGKISSTAIALIAVRSAINSGAPYKSLLADSGIPESEMASILVDHAESGVATESELLNSFEPAARAVLKSQVDSEADEGIVGGISAFFGSLVQVRSLTPREGDDPVSILSRAEAALRANRIDEALDELRGLPDQNRAAIDGWIESAETRLAALAAIDALANSR